MRNIQTLTALLNKAGIQAKIVLMAGECIGVTPNPHLRQAVKVIAEYTGYTAIQRHEYEHTHGKTDAHIDTIILF